LVMFVPILKVQQANHKPLKANVESRLIGCEELLKHWRRFDLICRIYAINLARNFGNLLRLILG